MLIGPVTVQADRFHLEYRTGLRAGGVVVALYVLTTCGAFLLSRQKVVAWFGVVNLVAVAVLAVLVTDGFASLWCAWAAVTSAAFAVHLRQPGPREELSLAAST